MTGRKWWITESIPEGEQTVWYGICYRKEDKSVLCYDTLTTRLELLQEFLQRLESNHVEDCHIEDVFEDLVTGLYLPPQHPLA